MLTNIGWAGSATFDLDAVRIRHGLLLLAA
jgi:hypothetical protein